MTIRNEIPIEYTCVQYQLFKTAIKNSFVADALAMPVHWYYRVGDILKAFPDGVDQLYSAPRVHPSSIMSLHSKQQGGRAHLADQGLDVVGDVILKDKAQFWNQSNVHYHHGMQAGENTLNAHTVLWMMQSMLNETHQGGYDQDRFLDVYISRMTADTTQHPDTYAESYHRGFFANWAQGKAPEQCAAVTHDTPSIGGLVRVGPLVLLSLSTGLDLAACKSIAARHLKLTHPDSHLTQVCFQYIDLIYDLLQTEELSVKASIVKKFFKQVTGKKFNNKPIENCIDNQVIGGIFSSACYITDAWPSVLYLASKYPESSLLALRKNAELGGDSVHRGSVLAVIMALLNGQELEDMFNQLALKDDINHSLNLLMGSSCRSDKND